MMKKKSKVTVLTDILMLIMLFFAFLCSIIADKYTIMSKYIFLNIFGNEIESPIVEIDISRWRCKSDFEPLFNYEYPGHYSGCYNNITGDFNNFIKKEQCIKYNSTFYIDGVTESPMNAWRSKVICIRREDYSKITQYVLKDNDCPNGYKFCGFLNQFKDKYCVLEKFRCPIYYLEIKPKTYLNLTDDTIQFKVLDGKNLLLYSNNSTEKLYEEGSYIKNDFKVGVNYPCIKKNRISTNGNNFPLIKEQNKENLGCVPKENNDDHHETKEGDEKHLRILENNNIYKNLTLKNNTIKKFKNDDDFYFDKRYTVIDSYLLSDFNTDNDLKYLNEIPNLKNWTRNKDELMYLYSKPYTYPNFTCANLNKFINLEEMYKNIKLQHYIVNVILLCNLICFCLFISLLSLMKITSRNQNLGLSLIKIIISSIFLFYIAKYIFSIRSSDQEYKILYIKLFDLNDCIDPVSKNALDKIYHFKDALIFRQQMIEIIFYTGYPYFTCIIIQFLKFLHKVYLRIRNKDRNKEAKGLLDILGDSNNY